MSFIFHILFRMNFIWTEDKSQLKVNKFEAISVPKDSCQVRHLVENWQQILSTERDAFFISVLHQINPPLQ